MCPIAFKLNRNWAKERLVSCFDSFVGFIFEAFDQMLQQEVALKVEKKDKNKNILMFEYQVL